MYRVIANQARPRTFAFPMPVSGLVAFGVAALLSHASTDWRAADRLAQRLPTELEGQVMMVDGAVLELPRRSAQGLQFAFGIDRAARLDGTPLLGVPPRVWLGWWRNPHGDALDAAVLDPPRPGQRWRLPVVLRRPHGPLNPHGFDVEWWQFVEGYGASGQVSSVHAGRAQRMSASPGRWVWMQGWRADLRDRIDRHLADGRIAGLVAGLTIGEQAAVEARDWALFRDTGVAHVLAISGLHITIFAALVAPVGAWLWRRSMRLCLWLPAVTAGAVLGWGAAWAYALLAGWGLPAQRTVVMLGVTLLARATGLSWPAVWVWLLAAAPVVLWDPWAVGQPSFWLSFAAVGLLLLSAGGGSADPRPQFEPEPIGQPGRSRAPARWKASIHRGIGHLWAALRQQAWMALGLAPLAAVYFHQVSWVGLVANLLVVPWITAVVTPLALLGLLWPAVWGLLEAALWPVWGLLGALAGFPAATVPVAAAGGVWIVLGLGGAALALMPLPLRMRLCGLLLMLPLLWPPPPRIPEGRFEVWGLDVGQGSAILLRTRSHVLLVDGGPAMGGADAGARIVAPTLRALGVGRIDLLVVTHRDADHAGGVAAVMEKIATRRLLVSLEPDHPILHSGVPNAPCQAGQSWWWDGVRFDVLHPAPDDRPFVQRGRPVANSMSCVLRVQDARGRSLLMTGDIEAGQEAMLRTRWPDAVLRSDALIVPHHGSRTSSSAAFLQSVAPQWALAQAGHRNPHGHPAPGVVQRYRDFGIALSVSPSCGAWHWPMDGPPQCWRDVARRYWHAGAPGSVQASSAP